MVSSLLARLAHSNHCDRPTCAFDAKRTGDKVTNEAMKIMINGSFGKFGSKWSVLYSPDLLIQTTVTGQLAASEAFIDSDPKNAKSRYTNNTFPFLT